MLNFPPFQLKKNSSLFCHSASFFFLKNSSSLKIQFLCIFSLFFTTFWLLQRPSPLPTGKLGEITIIQEFYIWGTSYKHFSSLEFLDVTTLVLLSISNRPTLQSFLADSWEYSSLWIWPQTGLSGEGGWKEGPVVKNLLFFQRTQVQFSVQTWQLMNVCNSSSTGSAALV